MSINISGKGKPFEACERSYGLDDQVPLVAIPQEPCQASSSTGTQGSLRPRAGGIAIQNAFINDPHSYARPWEAKVTHMTLTFSPNFEDKILTGKVIYTYKKDPHGLQLRLDCKNLNITKVESSDGTPLAYTLSETDSLLGCYLAIELPKDAKPITIEYTTSREAEGLYWNENNLYTHSQPIYTRSWLPCQDSPTVRCTYTAEFLIPEKYNTGNTICSLMSCQNNPRDINSHIKNHQHVMEIPIPSYLMAFSLGEYVYHQTGPRTGIYAKADLIDQAKKEFAHLESILAKAERIFGSYGDWERYDILIVSGDFPASATENPCITFFGPIILSGDGSNAYIIYHEIAHSWSGNKTTAAGWEHLWLNEGCTTYFENRILEEIEGYDAAALLTHQYYHELSEEFEELPPEDQCLRLKLSKRNPRDSFSSTAYYKGFLFLKMLEHHFGREPFTEFMKMYFNVHKYMSVTTEAFEQYLDQHLFRNDPELKEKLRVIEWIYESGTPRNLYLPPSKRIDEVVAAREDWLSGGRDEELIALASTFKLHEWRFFMLGLKKQTPETLRRLDVLFTMKKHQNLFIRDAWLTNALDCGYFDVLDEAVDFVLGTPKPGIVKKYMTKLISIGTSETILSAKLIYEQGIVKFSTRARDTLIASTPEMLLKN